eukprot:CAMPEP_0113682174 /NCGR_PEP_ID=MMETSP0038_2-20120614/12482_1 /TAXON_ID=2898 /ORGANISM="Cryptomonas paramecium" /LENGTH=317 /DNA_ID=CAMNT_0000601145 /DNA_START=10 /DNA_END=963 /DNA_ORIENTATION=+ /assembly_acc=CAM_ASM_000170
MSYRPHKRKKATTLKERAIEAIAANLNVCFKPGVLSLELRCDILKYLCFSPELVHLPADFFAGMKELCFGGCSLQRGLLKQVAYEAGPTLLDLDLRQCSGHEILLMEGFQELCDRCSNLRRIDLVGVMTLTDSQLAMMHSCRNLHTVLLGGCIVLTPAAITSFLETCGGGLEILDLSGCRVDAQVMEALSRCCTKVRELSLGYLEEVPFRALPLLLRNAAGRITSLALNRSVMVGDSTLLLLGRHMAASLTSLDITGCKRVTREGVLFLAWHCKELRSLKVRYCAGMSSDFQETLPKIFPQIPQDKIERDKPRFFKD